MIKRLFLLFPVIGSVFLLTGCAFNPAALIQQKMGEKTTEKLIESQTGGKVDINSEEGKVTIKGKEGEEVIIGGGQLPSNFPKDVPIYPGAKPAGSWTSTTGDEKGVLVTLETNDGKNKVVSFYSAELPKNGWTIETTTTTDEGVMYIIKKNTRTGWVTITAEKNSKTTIGLVVSDEKELPDSSGASGGSSLMPASGNSK